MEIGTLSVEAFRNLAPSRLGFHPRLNLLVGANGQGKTNVLESLALVSGRPSFRTTDLSEVLRSGAAEATVAVRLDGEPAGTLGAVLGRGRREHAWNGRRVSRLEASRRLPLVLLTTADLTRLTGPPAERRRALDRVALLLAPGRPDRDALDAFEDVLGASGAAIAAARRRALGPLGRNLEANARLLGGSFPDVALRLVSDLPEEGTPEELAAALRRGLRAREADERRAGRALFGPHRDDVRLVSGATPIASRASSGEARTLVLAWALAERSLLAEATGTLPVFAFDEFDSEWDRDVLAYFARALPDDGQLFLTSARADVARALPLPPGAVFTVDGGALSPAGLLSGRPPAPPPAAAWAAERPQDVLAS